MNDKILLTIGRQYGSGGHEVGQRLSQMLNIELYDKEILKETAKQSGINADIFEKFDEKPTNSFLYSLVMGTNPMQRISGEYELPLPEKVFLAEFKEIQKIADKKSGIFVGRCADYALKDYSNHIGIFVYAPLNKRIERIMQRQNINKDEAAEMIRKIDKQRSSYYNYYTTKKWGSIDSSVCGMEGTVNIISRLIYEKGLLK